MLTENNDLINLATKAAVDGGAIALKYFRNPDLVVKNKGLQKFDPVTEADLETEKVIRNIIKRNRPLDMIFGEETGETDGNSEYFWLIDPIDGTRAFIAGIPVWTVLIAVMKNKVPILGVIHQPFTGEIFVGGFGSTELISGGVTTITKTRKCSNLRKAVLATTFPEIGTKFEMNRFNAVRDQVKLTRYGLDAYAYALLALGQLDIVIEAGLKPHDVNAPIAVVEAAGGIVTDWSGKKAYYGGQILACGDIQIHEQAVKILSLKGC